MSRSLSFFFVLVGFLCAGLVSSQDVSSLPPECLTGAISLQQACSAELAKALTTLGAPPSVASSTDITAISNVVKTAAANGKGPVALAELAPSAGCCRAACSFAATTCLCNTNLVGLVAQVAGIDAASGAQITSALASKCSFKDISIPAGTCTPGIKAPALQCPA
ncbi:hypothetical protein V8C86DRAFT_2462751 [Haematococcus lacustris]